MTQEDINFGGKNSDVLKRFMKEFFPFSEFKKIGFFKPELKNDYYAQAKRVCTYFGYYSVFEYGDKEITCHISYVKGQEPENNKFLNKIHSIYD